SLQPFKLLPPIQSGVGKCVPDVVVSPDDKSVAFVCDDVIMISGVLPGVRVQLPDGLPSISELSPVSEEDCLSRIDSVATSPWEKYTLVWSHDSRQVYWCGKGREHGYVVDRVTEAVQEGLCLRAGSWSNDDSQVVGVVECGHGTRIWSVSTALSPEGGHR